MRSSKFVAGLCLALGAGAALDNAAADTAATEDAIVVEGARASSAGATGLDLTLRETPQSVTIIPQQQIQDFGLNNVNALLEQAPGVNVERTETERTNYTARGFDITNFQVDGIGLPLTWGVQYGDSDTVLFDRVEVIRGATSMLTGVGNPSAAVNYVRKRPTEDLHVAASVQRGSWDDTRIEGDVSGPLSADGALTGRLVYANEDRDSYLDYYHVNRNVYYGVVSWQATPRFDLTAGYSMQDNRARGVMWGSLPFQYTDGAPISYDVSATASADWTYWNIRTHSLFADASYDLGHEWSLRAVGEARRMIEDAQLLYAYGNPDPATGLGVQGMTGLYPSIYNQFALDVSASGPFTLFGRRHELVLGANAAYNHGHEYENFYDGLLDYPAIQDWGRQQPAAPVYPGAYLAADQTDRISRAYAAAHLNMTDALKVVVGANAVRLTSHGYSYGTPTPRDESAISPYLGAVYDLTDNISLYASYTDIFNPQSEVDVNHQTLAAAKGESYEAGLKSEWFDGALYASFALFRGEQSGLAEAVGAFPNGQTYYAGLDTVAEGYELEIAGRVTPNWTISGGWTDLSIEDASGATIRTYTPRRTLKLATTYTLPALNELRFGAALRWQDDTSSFDIAPFTQPAYAVLDLMAGVNLTEHVRATLNINNATDEKHFNSLIWNQSYYGEPRNVLVSLDYAF